MTARWRSIVFSMGWRFVAVWLATLAVLWVTYALAHHATVDSMERELRERLATDTLVLEDHASRTLDGVVTRLEAVAALSAGQQLTDRRQFSQQLRDLLFDDTVVRSLSLVDALGAVVVSSNPSTVGQKVTPSVLANIGAPSLQPRKGVRFGRSSAQRDLTEPAVESLMGESAQAIWLAQIDAQTADQVGHRWVVAINSGFFQNFWSAATRTSDFQVGLFSYAGQRLVSLGEGPAASAQVTRGLAESLQMRESGEVVLNGGKDWLIRYRASERHPLAFVMFVDRASRVQQQYERTSALRWSTLGESLVASVVIGLFYFSWRRQHRFARTNKQLRKEAHTDALTGVANRRAFDELVPQEFSRAQTLELPLSLLVLDLDHFKSINDRFGHPAGDAVLREMAKRWQTLLRSQDLIARTGGEEFCVVLPGTGISQAETVALKLVEETRRDGVLIQGISPSLPVTVSIGVVGFNVCPLHTDLGTLLEIADRALYRAKREGRNRFVTFAWPPERVDGPHPVQAGTNEMSN